MKVVVLGGSAAGPNTGAGCSGYLLVDADTVIAIDLGPGTLPELRRHVDFRGLSGIVVSHYHLDHILDIGALRYLAKYNPRPAERSIPLWIPPGTGAKFAAWGNVFGDPSEQSFLESIFEIEEYNPGAGLRIGPFTIEMRRTVHPVEAYAMRVSAGDRSVFAYTADTGPTADLAGFFTGARVLVAEATEPAGTDQSPETRGHLTAVEAGRLAAEANVRALILAHRWEELGAGQAASEAQQAYSGPVLVARPGLTVFI